jgi:hypothetical protein
MLEPSVTFDRQEDTRINASARAVGEGARRAR